MGRELIEIDESDAVREYKFITEQIQSLKLEKVDTRRNTKNGLQ